MNFLSSRKNIFNIGIWLLYAIITLIATLKHEPNRDEAQVWLIVRDLNLSEIFSQIRLEGHPCLWYFIVLPFAKAGFPYITMQLAHWIISISAVALFIFKAPLNNLLKVLFIFSYFMLFQYAVIARNYSIILLALFLIATYYKSRFTNPYRYTLLITMLFNTHALAFGAAIGLTIIYFSEIYKEQKLKRFSFPLIIILSGATAFMIQLWPSAFLPGNALVHATTYTTTFDINTIWVILTGIQNAFIPVISEYEELKVALFFTLIFGLFFILFLRKFPVFIFLFVSSAWLFYFFATLLSGSWRHEALLLVFIMFSLWIMHYHNDKENFLSKRFDKIANPVFLEKFLTLFLAVCFSVNSVFAFSSLRKEFQYNFSGSKEMADYIKINHLEKNEIACYRSWRATALSPYLPITKLWFIDREEYGSFFILDQTFKKHGDSLTEEEVIKRTRSKYPKTAFLLLNEPFSLISKDSYTLELLYKNEKFIWGANDEKYFLYKIQFH